MPVTLGAQAPATARGGRAAATAAPSAAEDAPPPPCPPALRPWLGLYRADSVDLIIGEGNGALVLAMNDGANGRLVIPLRREGRGYVVTGGAAPARLDAERDARGRVVALRMRGQRFERVPLGPEAGNQLVVAPVRPVEELRREALAATPPAETGRDAPVDLAELVALDSTISLEVRYASTNNLFGTPVYSQARAFLQRPAAEALVRVHRSLAPLGLGLRVHDGYRPWYVTRMFWDAASPAVRPFVADPSKGSKHNRGAAVDLALYDRRTGATVPMPSTYDETTPRAYPDWPGGTARERWARDLLRRRMEREGFTVFELEWWHFDYAGWERWPILNVPFERLGSLRRSAP